MEWDHKIWMFYHWKWAGFHRYLKIGEYVDLVQDGESIIAYGHDDFGNLILGLKTSKQTPMKAISSGSTIGPITQLYPICCANNFGVVAQIPKAIDPDDDRDVHYLYVVLVVGVDT